MTFGESNILLILPNAKRRYCFITSMNMNGYDSNEQFQFKIYQDGEEFVQGLSFCTIDEEG